MDNSTPSPGVERRRAEKRAYEQKKILRLQEDEINRLKKEYTVILIQISDTEKNISRVNSIYSEKIAKLNAKISDVTSQKRQNRLKEVRKQTAKINSIQEEHTMEMQNMQADFEERIATIKSELVESLRLQKHNSEQKAIKSIQENAAEAIRLKSDEQHTQIQQRLNELKETVSKYRRRELHLRDAIKNAEREYQVAKVESEKKLLQLNAQRKEKVEIVDIPASKTEDIINMQRANCIAEINTFRDQATKELDKLNEELNIKKRRIFFLKKAINEAKTTDDSDYRKATYQVAQLGFELEHCKDFSIANSPSKFNKVERQILRRNRIILQQLEKSKNDRDYLIFENEKMRNEIRRLDYMVYGRSGTYQLKYRMAQKPFIPVGVFE